MTIIEVQDFKTKGTEKILKERKKLKWIFIKTKQKKKWEHNGYFVKKKKTEYNGFLK